MSAPASSADSGASSSWDAGSPANNAGAASTARPAWPGEAEAGASSRRASAPGGGTGLSPEDLAELQKTDPKRAKRILANRSSAARSKVRKLRYIAELEGKSAALQEEASRLHEELRKLQEDAVVLGQQNEELFRQAFQVQDHMQGQVLETERLVKQVARLQALHCAAAPALGMPPAAASLPAGYDRSWLPTAAPALQAQPPAQLPPLNLASQPQQAAQAIAAAAARLPSHSAGAAPPPGPPAPDARFGQQWRAFPRPFVRSPFELDTPGAPAPLHQQRGSAAAAAATDVDPKLLELLSLEPRQEALLPPHSRLPARKPGEPPSAFSAALSSGDSMASTALPSLTSGSSILEDGRGHSLSSLSTAASGALTAAAFELPPAPLLAGGAWRRNRSDPLSLQRSHFG